MKSSNLLSILNAYKTLPEDIFISYLDYHSINIKSDELNDLSKLVSELEQLTDKIDIFDKYFIGYSIPQIGKEFDLLRMGTNSIVNIELKQSSTHEKILKQLKRNKYYLSFLKKESFHFTYVSDENKLYELDENGHLVELRIRRLLAILASQELIEVRELDSLFNPSNYLVSPFNSTPEFVKGKYFLTNHQELIKKNVLKQIKTTGHSIMSIKGKAGTGKTLLTYDIANEVYQSSDVLIIHCGNLNSGHEALRDTYAWNIIPVKYLSSQDFSKYSLIVVDEAQRIYPDQLNDIITETISNSTNCIFSYDEVQTLRKLEIKNNISATIEDNNTVKPFTLTSKIRTNKEVASFIKCLINKDKPKKEYSYSNIMLNYFDDKIIAKEYLKDLKETGWKVINYTPSQYVVLPYDEYIIHGEDSAHTVIGQEFDNVVVIIDEYFYYKGNKLSTKNYKNKPYYHPTKMLFQIVSRAKIKLCLVIIKNQEILKRCLEILNSKD